MSKVKREYSTYFTHERQYSFIEEKIRRDFPYLFGIVDDDENEYNCEDIVRDTIKAVNKEIEEEKDPNNIESFKGHDLTLVRKQGNSYIYQVMLSISDGQEPHFHDETPFTLRVYSDDFRCEAVDYDYESGRLIFTTNRNLKSASYCKILLDSTFILEGLEERLKDLSEEGINEDFPFSKFLYNDTDDLAEVQHNKVPERFKQKLDDSQRKAFDAALDKDITFIWGPPGTGKSFTLASIIYALYELGEERTAVCCLSNVAVDQLLCKVLDLIDLNKQKIEPGNIYRAGRTLDKRVLSTDYLFPKDQITQKLRNRIKQNLDRIQWLKERKKEKTEESILLKAENKDHREELKKHTEFLVKSSRLVFSTISNFVLSNSLYQSRFENLIVDEASMMAMPSLLALGHKISKRLILVGDFQQLSPIALIKDPALTESVFEMNDINIKNTNHPALHQLLHQRRSDKQIVELINNTFYEGKLIPAAKENEDVVEKEPFAGKVIALCDCDGAVRFSKGGTRQNKCFAENVMNLLDIFYQDKKAKYTIGVITPYRGQVSLIRALKFERQYSDEFEERVRIGTIHTFQGSECDVIIFDMVDCPKSEKGNSLQIGRLYAAKEGERLLNVAVSRAKFKLIVVCDKEYIKNIPGNKITDNTRALFHKLSKYKAYKLQDHDDHLVPQDLIDEESNDIEDEFEWFFVDSVPFSKASKDLNYKSCDCRVVLSTLGYYLEVNDEYIKLGDYPNGYSYDKGSIWIKKALDDKGRRMVHDTEDGMYLIGYIREDDSEIVYTNPDGEEFTITFNS
ncbi:MAG: AAA family ATPase [Prevotella sp.]|nr:AAA family ATPase [Prevotella sp.]